MAQLRNGLGQPAEVRIRYLGNDGQQHIYTITAASWQLNLENVGNSWDNYLSTQNMQYSVCRQTATLKMDGIGKASPPPESLAVQMARAILEGDSAAAMALADAIVNNPEEAFACAYS